MEEESIDVSSRARMMSRRLKMMNKTMAVVKIDDGDDGETKRQVGKFEINNGGCLMFTIGRR